jgi:branched-chain amino acid aminotransferase
MVDLGKNVWMDGDWVEAKDANVSIMTHSMHYGLSIFDGIRCYQTADGPKVFRLREHMQRFVNSCKIVGMIIDYNVDQLEAVVLETLRRNRHKSCYIRPLAYYGDDRVGLNTLGMKGRIAIMTWEWGAYLGEEGLLKGIRVKTSSYTRHHPNITMIRAKIGGNYVNSQLAKAEALADGYDEAMMLDPEGFLVEGSGENLFIVEGAHLVTPSQGSILPGITRDTVMSLAQSEGIPVKEDRLTRDRVLIADEFFLSGTAAEITPVREMDRRPIGTSTPGPITKKIQELFFKVVGGEIPDFDHWLTPVPTKAQS